MSCLRRWERLNRLNRWKHRQSAGTHLRNCVWALREQQVVLDSAGVGIAFIRQRAVIRCNQRFAEIYGYAQSTDIIGQSARSLYQSDADFRALGEAAYAVMAKSLAYKADVLMQWQDGQPVHTRLPGKLVDPKDAAEGSIWIVVALKILQSTQLPIQVEQFVLAVTASIGVAVFPADGAELDTLSRSADAAMYRAKADGRNSFRFFTLEMQAASKSNLLLGNVLHHADARK